VGGGEDKFSIIGDNSGVGEHDLKGSTTTKGDKVGERLGEDETICRGSSPGITDVSKWCLSREVREK
jgi:hypothetical protein